MKKSILFVNDEMMIGGVSRILNTLLSMLDKEKYDIDLLVLHPRGGYMQEIPEGINVIETSPFFEYVDQPIDELTKEKDIKGIIKKSIFVFYMKSGLIKRLIRRERKKILKKQYDVEFSAKEGFCTIFNACGDAKLKLNWIQTDYEKENYAKHHIELFEWALSKIDMNIASSDGVKAAFEKVFDVHNISIIHNLMDEERIRKLSLEEVDHHFDPEKFNMIAVARFHPQKGLDRLLAAVKKMKDLQMHVSLILIGDGILNESLHKQTEELGLNEEVQFLGYQMNPYPYIRQSDLFVMTSLFEGYPTITIESLISTTPVFTTEVSGVSEQIKEVYEGKIVKNDQIHIDNGLIEMAAHKEQLREYKRKLENYHYENDLILEKMCELLEGRFER